MQKWVQFSKLSSGCLGKIFGKYMVGMGQYNKGSK